MQKNMENSTNPEYIEGPHCAACNMRDLRNPHRYYMYQKLPPPKKMGQGHNLRRLDKFYCDKCHLLLHKTILENGWSPLANSENTDS